MNFSGCDLRGSGVSAIHPENSDLRGAIVTIEQAVAIAQALGLDVRADSGEDDDADRPIR